MSTPDKSDQQTGSTKFKPGRSGNPSGRPPGKSETQKLRDAIGKHVPDIITKLVEQAKGGDASAARLLLERVLPPMKPTEQAQRIEMPADADLSMKGNAVMQAAADGLIPAAHAASLMTALGNLARVVEVDALQKRIEALEAKQ